MGRLKYLAAALLLLVAANLSAAPEASEQDPDRAQLMSLKKAFETAFATGRFETLEPYVDDSFGGTILLKDVKSREEFKALWTKIVRDFGEGKGLRRYRVRINPGDIEISGGTAAASGTTDETVETPLGPLAFHSKWSSRLVKKDGRWKLSRMESQFNPVDRISTGLTAAVRGVWSALRLPNDLRRAQPDFDHAGSVFQFKGQ